MINNDNSVEALDGISGFINRLKRFIASMIFLPDEERNWIIPAVIKALRIIRQEKIKYVLTSCPPYSVHLVGLLLKLINPRIKWIADFRDPWMTPIVKEVYPTTAFSNFFEYKLERLVIKKSDLVLTTTQLMADKLAEYYNKCQANKFKLIPNGFDSDAVPAEEKAKYDTFTVSYTGSLYFGRTPEPVFQAVASLLKNNHLESRDIRIKLVGQCDTIDGASTTVIAKKYNLTTVVEVIDSVPYNHALEIIQRSHVALLLAPAQPYQIPAKAYEYIGLGTPILALTGEGATADLINSVSNGKAVHPDNVEEIEEYLLEMIKAKDSPERQAYSVCRQYTRKLSVRKISKYINML